jgi:glycosyltransferase involved in cell wall biosynthesis
MPIIDIFIPTYHRAARLRSVSDNIHDNTTVDHRILFIIEAEDEESAAAVPPHDDYVTNTHRDNYAGAINTGFENLLSPFFFMGADDLNFHADWDEKALVRMDDRIMVVGTDDLLNPYVKEGLHSTHSLVNRQYIDGQGGVMGETGTVLSEVYDHQFTDTEFIATAKMRARFYPALDSVVEHIHFANGRAQMDETYTRGQRLVAADEQIYDSRKHLWQSLSR